jgi:hypothetical protein
VKRIIAYPAVILTAVVAFLVGSTVSASAQVAYPTNFVVTHGSVVSVGGQNYMKLSPIAPSRSAYSDYFIGNLGVSWSGRTVKVCVTARANYGTTAVAVSWWANGVSYWQYYNTSVSTQCYLTYNNVGGANADNYRVSVYVNADTALVRSVEIYPI